MFRNVYEKCKSSANIKDCPEPEISEIMAICQGVNATERSENYDLMIAAFNLGVLKERSRAEYARKKARAAG